ncbi:MAG: regulatory protein RecX [Clostridia bacterium]|nr:regulatory protein RecX [Clostridia bacterium]
MICSAVLISETDVFVTIAGEGGTEEKCLSPNRWKRLIRQMGWQTPPIVPFPITAEFYDRLTYESDVTAAIRCAARIQSQSPKSKRELIRKLREKGFKSEPAEEAAAFLVQKGYLKEWDQAYAFAENAITRKRYGKRRISASLLAHGYESETIRDVLAQIPDDLTEEALRVILKRKYTPFPTDAKERQKAFAALMRLGFTGGEIQSAIRETQEKGDE